MGRKGMDQQPLLILCFLLSSQPGTQVQSSAPVDSERYVGELGSMWKRASEEVWKRGSSNLDRNKEILKPPFEQIFLELNREDGVDTMKRGLASLIRPRFGKRNFSSFRMSNRLTAKPESRHGGTAFANFIFDLAKHMKPETNEIFVHFGGEGDSELANLIGLRERLGNEVAMREMLGKRSSSAPTTIDKVVFDEEQPKLLLF